VDHNHQETACALQRAMFAQFCTVKMFCIFLQIPTGAGDQERDRFYLQVGGSLSSFDKRDRITRGLIMSIGLKTKLSLFDLGALIFSSILCFGLVYFIFFDIFQPLVNALEFSGLYLELFSIWLKQTAMAIKKDHAFENLSVVLWLS
jgi:hypothetical protein